MVVVAGILGALPPLGPIVNTTAGLTIIVLAFAFLIFLICLIKQRANDIGWHPVLITALSIWTPVFLIIGFIPGQTKPNKYGQKPRPGIKF
jgi:uncharacterized membrane protein YhaH (DUF805 family)